MMGRLMQPVAAFDGMIFIEVGDIDRVKRARAAAILTGYIDPSPFCAGGAGLFRTEHSEHVLCTLSRTAAFECRGLRPEDPNVVFGEKMREQIDTDAFGNVIRAECCSQHAEATPVIFKWTGLFRHML